MTLGKRFFVALLFFGLLLASSASAYEVTTQTTDCSGNVGFTSFDSNNLHKIQAGNCFDKNTGKKLQQVLLKSKSGLVNYEMLWVTQEEAGNIMKQIKEFQNAKIQHLTQPKIIVEKETIIKQITEAPPVAVVPPAPTAVPAPAPTSVVRGDLPGPKISIIDPPITNTRSISKIITSKTGKMRTIVGKIDAPAGILSLSVNDQPQALNEHGMFKTDIAVEGSETPVTVVAVDNQGKRENVVFHFLPEPEEMAAMDLSQSSGTDASIFGKYYALVIANNKYEKLDDLKTPKNDADAISDILTKKYGFTVTRLDNANRYTILSALNTLRRDLTEKDNLLIYYAGHGEYDKTNNRGHWLPVDSERDSTANWISTIAITDIINAMSVKHVLVVADSCYSGALTRTATTELDSGMSEDARMKWLRVVAKTRSRYVLTSGGVKPVIDDSGNGHSIFANALITILGENKGILEGSKLFEAVKSEVTTRAEELNINQSPQYAQLKRTGHEFGEFLLVGQKP